MITMSPSVIKATLLVMILCALDTGAQVENIARKGNNLVVNFYQATCPQAEKIVGDTVTNAFNKDKSIAAALVRLPLHDCFVRGCDASIMLDITPQNAEPEIESPANKKSVRGLEVIDQAKAQLEKECPGIVSCADIIAFAGRDAFERNGFPYFPVPGGRRDGRISNAQDTTDLPAPTHTVALLTELFAKKGLTQEDMVALVGAHTLGTAHCSTFLDRIHYLNPGKDETIDPAFESQLIKTCPILQNFDTYVSGPQVPFDPDTPDLADNKYFNQLIAKKGLLRSDQVLMLNPNTSALVKQFAANAPAWEASFKKAYVKMTSVEVLTGTQGEIRRQCHVVN